jgi:ABC-2 type transport system permease protein
MSTDLLAGRPVAIGRTPRTVIAALTAVKAARSALGWGAVFGLYTAVSAVGYSATYKTPGARAQLERTFGANVGFNALVGPAHQIGTVAGFTAWRALGVLTVVGSVWGLLTGTRLLRGEEDAGRWEPLLVGQTTRRGGTVQALTGLGGGLLTLWATTGVITAVVGQAKTVHIGLAPALFLAVALSCGAGLFLTVAALASQLAPTRRQAAGYCAVTLGIFYALRMIADSGTGLGWLRWLSPLGWVEQLRPLTSPRPLWLLPIAGLMVVLTATSVQLAVRRDLGDSVIPDRTSSPPHTRLLNGPMGLAGRLSRGVLAGWGASIAVVALLMGLIAKSVGDLLAANAADRKIFAKLGFRGSGAEQYLGVTFLIVALLVALLAAGQLSAARVEEAAGRLDHLLARPLGRRRWLLGLVAITATAVVVAGVVGGAAAWVGAASQGSDIGLPRLLGAGLNLTPPALFLLGAGTLALGLRARAVSRVMYGVLVWSFLVDLVGGEVGAAPWILDTSLFHQMAPAPAVTPDWVSGAVVTGLGVAAAAAGLLAFGHRDLAGE